MLFRVLSIPAPIRLSQGLHTKCCQTRKAFRLLTVSTHCHHDSVMYHSGMQHQLKLGELATG